MSRLPNFRCPVALPGLTAGVLFFAALAFAAWLLLADEAPEVETVLPRVATGAGSQSPASLTSDELAAGSHHLGFALDGHARRYLIHRPSGVDGPLPVVISFHGGGGRGELDARATSWIAKAEAERFLVAFPEGTAPDPDRPARFAGNPQSWNDGSARTGITAVERQVDDVAFFDALLEDIAGRCAIDRQRVYATGFSNGASMCFRLARERPTVLAATAPVAGTDWMSGKSPDRPVPLLLITGDSDPLHPLGGGEIRIGRKFYGTKPPVHETVANWVGMFALKGEEAVPTHHRDGLSRVDTYQRRGGPPLLTLRVATGHGHHWPGSPSLLPGTLAGPNEADFDAVTVIWDFFRLHRLRDGSVDFPPQLQSSQQNLK